MRTFFVPAPNDTTDPVDESSSVVRASVPDEYVPMPVSHAFVAGSKMT